MAVWKTLEQARACRASDMMSAFNKQLNADEVIGRSPVGDLPLALAG